MSFPKLFFSVVAFVGFYAATAQVPRKIIVEHFTNSKCSICASRNPGFFTNLNNQTNTLHLSIYPSAPYSSCHLYQQNPVDGNARTNYYGVYGSTPRLVVNGNVIPNIQDYSAASMFAPYQGLTSPVSIHIEQQKFGSDSIHATVVIKAEADNTLGSMLLFAALAEDTVFYAGTNGESRHYNVFRKALSAVTGSAINVPTAAGDSVTATFSSAANSSWNFNRIYTLALLQEASSKNVIQAEVAARRSHL